MKLANTHTLQETGQGIQNIHDMIKKDFVPWDLHIYSIHIYNVSTAVLAQNHTEAICERARSGGPRLHISRPQFVLLSILPRNSSCDPFLGNKCQGQSHDHQPSQATIKWPQNWGNLPWLRFNKKWLHNSVRGNGQYCNQPTAGECRAYSSSWPCRVS